MKQLSLQFALLDEEVAEDEVRTAIAAGRAQGRDASKLARHPHLDRLPRERIVQPGLEKHSLCGKERLRKLGEDVLKNSRNSYKDRMKLSIYKLSKRAIDISLAAATLALLSPLLLIIAAIIKMCDGGSVLYRHERVGFLGKRFTCLKFRSMVLDADGALTQYLAENPNAREEWQKYQKLSEDPRITPLGSFLRKSSLDELPQLINILAGDMSLVGPRPIVADELDRYEERVGHYLAVKPGLTGLWQISGRNDCSYAERVELDVRYATTRSLWLDFIIMLKTVPAVISQRGSC
ncbi:MAG: sugar transferase [Hyphomicrobiaceae bacterium]